LTFPSLKSSEVQTENRCTEQLRVKDFLRGRLTVTVGVNLALKLKACLGFWLRNGTVVGPKNSTDVGT